MFEDKVFGVVVALWILITGVTTGVVIWAIIQLVNWATSK